MQRSYAARMGERDTLYQMVGLHLSRHSQELGIEKISGTSDAL